jgi:UPF0755 protein
MQRRNYSVLMAILILFVITASVLGFLYERWFARLYGGKTVIVYIYPGDSVSNFARQLSEHQLAPKNGLFPIFFRWLVDNKRIKVGEYELKSGMNLLDLINHVESGRVKIRNFSIIPGWRVRTLYQHMNEQPSFEPNRLNNQVVRAALSIKRENLEGLFYPDTYRYYWGSSAMLILRKSYEKMQLILKAEWDNRASGLPFKESYDALIVASLIEKESHAAEERPMIARVILNRLKKDMLLQIDPTVLYAWQDQNLYRVTLNMLTIDSPYNTYRYKGLPPTPICLPSRPAIHAALHPAQSQALYYVALGDGIHHRFSDTYEQHLAYVKAYRKKLDEQRKDSLVDFPITLEQISLYWQSHCEVVDYWLPFAAMLVTLSEQDDGWLFLKEPPPRCRNRIPKKPSIENNHGSKQSKKGTPYQHRGHRGSREIHRYSGHSTNTTK